MLKSELMQIVGSRNPHLYLRDVDMVINTVLDEIVNALCRDDRVEIRGFGTFCVKNRHPRSGRNPRTGGAVTVHAKSVPTFRAGKELKMRLNAVASPKRNLQESHVELAD